MWAQESQEGQLLVEQPLWEMQAPLHRWAKTEKNLE